jgi:hypothetical protein
MKKSFEGETFAISRLFLSLSYRLMFFISVSNHYVLQQNTAAIKSERKCNKDARFSLGEKCRS